MTEYMTQEQVDQASVTRSSPGFRPLFRLNFMTALRSLVLPGGVSEITLCFGEGLA